MKKTDTVGLRERLIDWLATGGTIAAFHRENPARSLKQYGRWCAEPAFKAEVQRRSTEATGTLVHRVRTLSLDATTELAGLLKHGDPKVRLGAIRVVLQAFVPLATFGDIERRLTEVEEKTSAKPI